MTSDEKQGLLFVIVGLYFMQVYQIDPNSLHGMPVWIFLAEAFYGAILFLWGGKKKTTP